MAVATIDIKGSVPTPVGPSRRVKPCVRSPPGSRSSTFKEELIPEVLVSRPNC